MRSAHRDSIAVVIGGDLHLHSDTRICNTMTSECVPQVITSGMTNGSMTISGWHLFLFQVRCLGLICMDYDKCMMTISDFLPLCRAYSTHNMVCLVLALTVVEPEGAASHIGAVYRGGFWR